MIHVVGCGWYACHLIDKLIHDKFDYVCWERNDEIFNGSSSKNQNRLHLGFHYPRNSVTRKQSREGFSKFIDFYPDLSCEISDNIYAVANDSIIDFQTYKSIFLHENYSFEEIDVSQHVDNIEGMIISSERLILHNTSKKYWESKNFNIEFNENVALIDGKLLSQSGQRICSSKDVIIDCTYGNLIEDHNYYTEYFLSFVVHISNLFCGAMTVMDGPFFSIFPYENDFGERLYTLTHVKFGILKSKNIEKIEVLDIFSHVVIDCIRYLGLQNNDIKLVDYFISKKTKPFSSSESRAVEVKVCNNLVSVRSGKIDAIFYAEEKVSDALINLV